MCFYNHPNNQSFGYDLYISSYLDITEIHGNNFKGTGEKSVSETEWITRHKYHVSMVSSQNILKGDELTVDMVSYRNPGTGIPAKDAHKIIGKKALKNISEDELLSFNMFA